MEQEATDAATDAPARASVAALLAAPDLAAPAALTTPPPAPLPSAPAPARTLRPGVVGGGARIGVLLALVYALVFNLSTVRGSSMSPSIADGDRILVDHLSPMLGEIERGDIVVLQYPLDPALDYIKRVIGLPGDEIRIDAGIVWVNGEPIDEPYLGAPDPYTSLRTRVAEGCYFVLGDNRLQSSDSREFGFVPRDHVRGRAELRVWPLARAGALP
jgi:signal peptidase I